MKKETRLNVEVINDKDYQMNLTIGNQIFRINNFKLTLVDSELESGSYEMIFRKKEKITKTKGE